VVRRSKEDHGKAEVQAAEEAVPLIAEEKIIAWKAIRVLVEKGLVDDAEFDRMSSEI